MVRLVCQEEGYEVVSATDSEEAFQLLERPGKPLRPNLVILDIVMPNVDGLGLGKMIREKSDVPILYMTAAGEYETHPLVTALASGFIMKPFNIDQFLGEVKELSSPSALSNHVQ